MKTILRFILFMEKRKSDQKELLIKLLKDFMWARNELRHTKDAPISVRALDADGAFLKNDIKIYLLEIREKFGIIISRDDFDKEMKEIYSGLKS